MAEDDLPKEMDEIIDGMHRGVYKLQDLKDLAQSIIEHLTEEGYELTLEYDGSITAVKTEYL